MSRESKRSTMFCSTLCISHYGLGLRHCLRLFRHVSFTHHHQYHDTQATNFQSRTALAIMPPLFVFGLTSEKKLEHDMKQMAAEGTDAWVKQQEAEQHKKLKESIHSLSAEQAEMMELYKDEVEHSGVRIVPGDTLGFHHKIANYWQANPFKILAAIGIPGVVYIFKGKAGQEHLQLQSKVSAQYIYILYINSKNSAPIMSIMCSTC